MQNTVDLLLLKKNLRWCNECSLENFIEMVVYLSVYVISTSYACWAARSCACGALGCSVDGTRFKSNCLTNLDHSYNSANLIHAFTDSRVGTVRHMVLIKRCLHL